MFMVSFAATSHVVKSFQGVASVAIAFCLFALSFKDVLFMSLRCALNLLFLFIFRNPLLCDCGLCANHTRKFVFRGNKSAFFSFELSD